MAFLPDELKRFEALEDEMAKLLEDPKTSSGAAVAYSKIGRICARAIADNAAIAAKRTSRASNMTKFQQARQKRLQAKKGGASSGAQTPPSGGQGQTQQRQTRQ